MRTWDRTITNASEQDGVQEFMQDTPEKIIYTYDGRNRLTGVRYENGSLATYQYDPAGNLISCTVSSPDEPAAAGPAAPAALQPVPAADRTMFCTGCGVPVAPGKNFCGNCGRKIR